MALKAILFFYKIGISKVYSKYYNNKNNQKSSCRVAVLF